MDNIFVISVTLLAQNTEETFKACFGLPADVAATLAIQLNLSFNEQQHLSWTLMFLRIYPTELKMEATIGKERHTIMKHVNEMLSLLDRCLPQVTVFINFSINFDTRRNNSSKNISKVVDVTRCRINQPKLQPWAFYSAKDKFFTVKYEVVCSYKKPYKIIWLNGPFKGAVADIRIYREHLK